MSLLRFLGISKEHATSEVPETDAVRKIARALDQMDPEHARYIASFAFILSRAARADLSISEEETRAMERIVMEVGELPEDQAILVVQIAKTQNRLFGATENFLVTREFRNFATKEQKMRLLDCMYAVSAADDSISNMEDSVIRRIAGELGLEHHEFIEVRSKYRDRLSVLKRE